MKKTFTFFASFFLLTIMAVAQITTAEMPVVGTHIVYKNINKNGFDPLMSVTGIGVSWDYTNIIEKPDSVILDYIDTATTAQDTSFPTATVAEALLPDTSGHFYYQMGAGLFQRNGFYDAANKLLLPYADPMKMLELPFVFGMSFTEYYTCTNGSIDISGTIYPAIIDNGNYAPDVDGFGTLHLPTGQYNNVYRLAYTETFTIKADIGLGYMGLIGIDEYGYEYWKAGHIKPILTYYNTTTSDLVQGGTTTTVGVRYNKHAIPDGPNPGINENDAAVNIRIFPNPSAGIITINAPSLKGTAVFEVSDILGNKVYSGNVNNKQTQINLSCLCKGIYNYSLTSDNFRKNGKLVIGY